MYALYAEDTSSQDKSFIKIKDLRSTRFARAMREARQEPAMQGCRLFVAPWSLAPEDVLHHREYLDAPTAQSNQALNRTTLQRQTTNVRKMEW